MDYKLFTSDTNIEPKKVQINNHEVSIKTYLPIAEKANFINFIANGALDDRTGCFSPLRVKAYQEVAFVKWYSDIKIPDNIAEVYDSLRVNGIIDAVIAQIDKTEYSTMVVLVKQTIEDISNYNRSFAGILNFAAEDTNSLSSQINEVLANIKDRKGLELLGAVKDVVGTD